MPIVYNTATGWDQPQTVMVKGVGKKIYASHQSTMDEAEVLRLARAGVALLLSKRIGVKGIDPNLRGAINAVEVASKNQTIYVTVTKGIHQFSKLPHITLRISSSTMHVWLSNEATSETGRYLYKPVAVSGNENGPFIPNIAVGQRLVRRGSISFSDLTILESEKARLLAEAADAQENLKNIAYLEAYAQTLP